MPLIPPPGSVPGHKLQKPSKESGIFQSLVTIDFVLFYQKIESKGGGHGTMPPINTLQSVGKCSGLGLAWSAQHCLTRFLSSTSPLFKSKPPV